MDSPVVPLAPDEPVLGDAKFWDVDHSTRWLRCLHTVAWCAATGTVATGVLAAVRPADDHNPVGLVLACVNLAVLAGAGLLAFWQYFGRGGQGPKRTSGYRWINLQGSHPVLPYVQGALGWLTFGQAIAMIALAGCVGRLAWQLRRGQTVSTAKDRTGSDPWGPMLRGMLAVVVAQLGWLLGLAQSAGYGRWVADRLGGAGAPAGAFQPVLPNFYTWIDAYAVVAIVIAVIWALCLIGRVIRRTGEQTTAVLAGRPIEPGASETSTAEESQSRATAAARWRVLAQSVETVPPMLAAAAVAGSLFLLPGWFVQFAVPGWIRAVASVGAWVVTAGTAGMVLAAYLAFRNQSTRRVVGILWDVTTFWPRANHPLTPPCSAQRAVPQLADRIAALTKGPADALVLSAHSQGSVLAAAAALQLGHDKGRPGALERMSLLTYGSPLRRLYARAFPAYFSEDALAKILEKTSGRWLNLWAWTDPIGADIALPSPGHAHRLADAAGPADPQR
jgi:hypothetical protein